MAKMKMRELLDALVLTNKVTVTSDDTKTEYHLNPNSLLKIHGTQVDGMFITGEDVAHGIIAVVFDNYNDDFFADDDIKSIPNDRIVDFQLYHLDFLGGEDG